MHGLKWPINSAQVHTADGAGFGQGNCGRDGMHKFLCSHQCNEICALLGMRQVQVERVKMTVVVPDGTTPGDVLDRCIEGPDGQLHDFTVPRRAQPGDECEVILESVAAADRANVCRRAR